MKIVLQEDKLCCSCLGRRTIDESFKLGEMLANKKAEKKHGEWLPFLEWCGIKERTARNLIKSFNDKDRYVEGMTFKELVYESATVADLAPEPKPSYQPGWRR